MTGSRKTHIISTINLKGGVGKTTVSVALADFLSYRFNKRVLVVDLDPQTNATLMLIGEIRWRQLNDAGNTLVQLFRDELDASAQFDLKGTLQRNVSNVWSANSIDLLPSSLDLIELQDRLTEIPRGKFNARRPCDGLWRRLKDILPEYDFVIVDCPPNLGIITQNGLRLSDKYIIPVIPDYLSTYGIPQIVSQIEEFAEEIAKPIEPLGIVISKYRKINVHMNTTQELIQKHKNDPKKWPTVFKQPIRLSSPTARAAEFTHGDKITIKQKWGSTDYHSDLLTLTEEILQSLGETVENRRQNTEFGGYFN